MSVPVARPAQRGLTRRLGGWGGAVGLAVLLALLAALAYAEWRGWPWLAGPVERSLSSRLGRPLRLHAGPQLAPADTASAASVAGASLPLDKPPKDTPSQQVYADFSLHVFGGLRLQVAQLEWAAPAWSDAPYTLRVQGLNVALRYTDLWRAWRGQRLRVQSLQADHIDGQLERLADGRASWQVALPVSADAALPPDAQAPPAQTAYAQLPFVHALQLRDGHLLVKDALLGVNAESTWAVGQGPAGVPQTQAETTGETQAGTQANTQLKLQATGQYQTRPLKIELLAQSDGVVAAGKLSAAVALHAVVGRARLDFDGLLSDVAAATDDLQGHFQLAGPSLAAVGDPVGVTLPTTGAFRSQGDLRKRGDIWYVVFDEAHIGGSQLQGAFTFDRSRAVPRLSGQLSGPRLLLKDLGPAVGVAPAGSKASLALSDATAALAPRPGKVLPDRPFDLAALRAMDANVLIRINEVDLNTAYLEPLRPLQAHLQLAGGVLDIGALNAQLGAGRIGGSLQLDGRGAVAAVRSDLRWDGLRLERWIHQPRAAADAPPFVSGALQGRARLQGQGRSTAQILGALKGQLRTELRDGHVSHLAIEAAGLDIAQALGVLIRGDKALPVLCAVADLGADHGVFVPRAMVLDSSDSTLWVDGSVSLASEALDLRVVVSPKDFSPLALRTPLRLRGTLSAPQVAIDGGRLAGRLGLAFLLALANPLAALVPLLDPGDAATAADNAAGCQAVVQRRAQPSRVKPALK